MQANASIKTSKLSPLADEKQRLFSVDNYLRVINDYSIEVSTLKTIDEIVWSIVNHAIAKLDFEDCVVYLVDPGKDVLIQKAAFGPKRTDHASRTHHPEEEHRWGLEFRVRNRWQVIIVLDCLDSVC